MPYREPTLLDPSPPEAQPRGWWVHAGFLVALALPIATLLRTIVRQRPCIGDGCGVWESFAWMLFLASLAAWGLYAAYTTLAVEHGDRRAASALAVHLRAFAIVVALVVGLRLLAAL